MPAVSENWEEKQETFCYTSSSADASSLRQTHKQEVACDSSLNQATRFRDSFASWENLGDGDAASFLASKDGELPGSLGRVHCSSETLGRKQKTHELLGGGGIHLSSEALGEKHKLRILLLLM